MRFILTSLICIIFSLILTGQTTDEVLNGTVSYITSQNIYVKFPTTESIKEGDTLFITKNGILEPAMRVTNLSSISCVCEPLNGNRVEVGDIITSIKNEGSSEIETVIPVTTDTLPETVEVVADTIQDKKGNSKRKEHIYGRVTVSSYSNFANNSSPMRQRMRYRFAYSGTNLNGSKVSVESYMTFVHSNDRWDEIKDDLFNGLKIYNLAVKYDFTENTNMWFGRRINPKISNVGAVDGLQFETQLNNFTVGAIAGSRPDYRNYGVDFNLLQFGAYGAHTYLTGKGNMQNSLAIVEQRNGSNTDRRFAYFQHTNTLVKNLYFFGSAELELYKVIDQQKQNTLDLANAYLSLRYRIIRPVSVSLSYSARNNVIYYESDKEFLDRLLEMEMLQGWRFQVNVRPARNLSIGLNTGYRYRKDDPRPSRNFYGYVSYNNVPGIDALVTLSATLLETAYLNGNIYALGLSRDIVPGKLFGGINFRMIDYRYESTEFTTEQKVGELNLTWKMMKKLSFSVYYEGTFEDITTYTRIYASLGYRF